MSSAFLKKRTGTIEDAKNSQRVNDKPVVLIVVEKEITRRGGRGERRNRRVGARVLPSFGLESAPLPRKHRWRPWYEPEHKGTIPVCTENPAIERVYTHAGVYCSPEEAGRRTRARVSVLLFQRSRIETDRCAKNGIYSDSAGGCALRRRNTNFLPEYCTNGSLFSFAETILVGALGRTFIVEWKPEIEVLSDPLLRWWVFN